MTEGQLREQLSLDLNALLNTINMETGFDLGEFPHVRESILNYGIPEISNRSIDEDRVASIVDEIRTALILFEPRLIAETLIVTRDMTVDPYSLNVRFCGLGRDDMRSGRRRRRVRRGHRDRYRQDADRKKVSGLAPSHEISRRGAHS